jgi:hypothetical protein
MGHYRKSNALLDDLFGKRRLTPFKSVSIASMSHPQTKQQFDEGSSNGDAG